MKFLLSKYYTMPGWLKEPIGRFWYSYLGKKDIDTAMTFMNYGYHSTDGNSTGLQLLAPDESERFAFQLYNHVVSGYDLAGKQLLEVGCGRGGGASYIMRYLKPEKFIGLDLAPKLIDFCNNQHQYQGLSFVQGNAMDLPFPDRTFDAVINIESSHNYGDTDLFFTEVSRVLINDGRFLFTDFRKQEELSKLDQQLNNAGFNTLSKTNISQNVVSALTHDHDRRLELIRQTLPGWAVKTAKNFVALQGSPRYTALANESFQYWSYNLIKRGG